MGRQYRSVRQGEGVKLASQHASSGMALNPGSSVVSIPNYGVSVLTGTTAKTYVLDAPVEGVRKTIFVGATVSTATVVRGATASGQTVTFNSTGGNTILTFAATVDKCIELMGISSTEWRIINSYPPRLAVNSTGIAGTTT